MSDVDLILAELRADFTYRADTGRDRWRVLRGRDGVIGDCEDFALTLAWRLAGQSWLRFWWHLFTLKSVVWYSKTVGSGTAHAVLFHRGVGWADNIYPQWRPKTLHKKVFPFLAPVVAVKMAAARLLQ